MNRSQISWTVPSNHVTSHRATNNLGPVPKNRSCENWLILHFLLHQKLISQRSFKVFMKIFFHLANPELVACLFLWKCNTFLILLDRSHAYLKINLPIFLIWDKNLITEYPLNKNYVQIYLHLYIMHLRIIFLKFVEA